jgi:choline dehydrogenase-like flavoprotein
VTRWLVVGGGAAGCVVAARLSERDDVDVVLLEAGPDHGTHPVPGDVGPLPDDPGRRRSDPVVRHRPDGPVVPYQQGFGLGGSSLINGSVVIDAPGVEDGHRLPLEAPWGTGAIADALLAADRDAALVRLVRRDGLRVTAADAYLRPAMDRPNLTVRTRRNVRRVVLDGRRAVGVVTSDGEEHAADRVVLCAGAIHSPTILLRSGVDTPGVGDGVQDHPAVTVAVQCSDGGADPSAPAISVAATRPGRQVLAIDHLPGASAFGALVGALTVVSSRGSVTLPDLEGPPRVHLGQLTDPADLDALVAHAADVLALLDHPAFRRVVEHAYVDDAGTHADRLAGDPAAIRSWVPDHLGGYQHVACSCRIGTVTDDDGAVRGYEGLFVGDASLFETVPPLNPYLRVVQQAERLAARWRDSTPR